MMMDEEPDFGAAHGVPVLVVDGEGTVSSAIYSDGTWWERRLDDSRVQLDVVPVRLANDRDLRSGSR